MNDSTKVIEIETRQIERVGLYSFLLNLGLAGLKAWLAYSSGSVAITASTIDSVTDSLASLAVWGGLKLSIRKSRSFPYGLYKIENFIQVGMALLIFLVGYEIAHEIFFTAAKTLTITPVVILGMGVSVVAPLLFGWYAIVIGRRTGSPALIADGRHRQADVLSSLVVLAAVISSYLGWTEKPLFWQFTVDRIAAGLILIFITYAGLELLTNGMRVLLDASIDPETLKRVWEIIESEPTVAEIQSLVGRSAGRYRFLEGEVTLRTADLEKAHTVSERIEENIRRQVSHIDRVLIHYEPRRKETLVVAVPLEADRKTVSPHFGQAPFFYVGLLRESDGQVLEERFLSNPLLDEEKAKGIKVANWLLQKGMDRLYSLKNLEYRGAGYVLSDAGVEVCDLEGESLSEIREQWKKPSSELQQHDKK